MIVCLSVCTFVCVCMCGAMCVHAGVCVCVCVFMSVSACVEVDQGLGVRYTTVSQVNALAVREPPSYIITHPSAVCAQTANGRLHHRVHSVAGVWASHCTTQPPP